MVKSLWASVVNNPSFMQKVNGWMVLFWVLMIPVSVFMGWIESVPYVSALSIYALITGHLSTWQASKIEVKQERQEDESNVEEKLDKIHDNLLQ